MEFKEFKKELQKHVDKITKDKNMLFVSNVEKNKLWNLYLDSFPPGKNEIFRERREYDCSCCRQFIKSFGNVVYINKNNEISTIWDFNLGDDKFQPVIETLDKFVKNALIRDVFLTKERTFGTDYNYEKLQNGSVHRWEHFRIILPKGYEIDSRETIGTLLGRYRDNKNVFMRSLEEISKESIETVLELISQKSLYKGDEWKKVLSLFLEYKNKYDAINDQKSKDNFCWKESIKAGGAISKIRNHSIGSLLIDINNGIELDDAVKRYERIVAPSNYKRPKAIFTKKMIDQTYEEVKELGLLDSLGRQYASLEDITINNILFANRDATKKITGNVFDDLKSEATSTKLKFNKVEKISTEHFVDNILPQTKEIELFVENKHEPNFVSLIGPKVKGSPSLFKWNNAFSWAYNGNITDSMKERVKEAGGETDGILRFSIQWNEDKDNNNDFDAHCLEPNGNRIFYSNKKKIHSSSGRLDVDWIKPGNNIAIENITYTSYYKMPSGIYNFQVHVYSYRGGTSGFRAEIEFDGQIYSFDYRKPVKRDETIVVGKVKYDNRNKSFELIESLDSSVSSKEIWNIKTNNFHSVPVLMFSPNYWDGQKGIGHKHYFFILNNCINTTQPNGFFNEFLKEDLIKHKKVFEALGSKMKVEHSENQLSGLGFSSTQRNSIVCKLKGNFERTIELNF